MARLSFRCDDNLVQAVDTARGAIARERFLRDLVSGAVGQPIAVREVASEIVEEAPEIDEEDDVEREREREAYEAFYGGDRSRCPKHPDAGRIKSRGRWYCAYPACICTLD